MYIQPYFPEPEVVPGNIADELYDVRLKFIRRVVGLHWLTIVLFWVCSNVQSSVLSTKVSYWGFFGGLVLLTASRRLAERSKKAASIPVEKRGGIRGPWPPALKIPWTFWGSIDWFAAWVVFPLTVAAGGQIFAGSTAWNHIATVIALSSTLGSLYVMLCGRDLSFTGMFTMAWAASLVSIVVLYESLHTIRTVWIAAIVATIYLFYFVYDLASLLSRRRQREEWLAVVDLYRDLLNFITYGFRVIHHWRTFKI
ncbi:MAG: hypothetical protein JST40_13530 [Armatimonadetes bacterium]|nr:hypothetical protein [Armatimonadota bacterium]